MKSVALFAQALRKLQIPYFVTGSVASSAHGMMRSTQDVDVVIDLERDQIPAMVEALGPDFDVDEEAVAEAVRRRWSANIFYLPDMTRFDLYVPQRTAFNESRMRRRVWVQIEATAVAVSSVEDSILKKLEWYRKGNELSQRQLEDVRGMMLVQGGNLDRHYLAEWARELGVEDLLLKFLDTPPPK